MMVPANAVMRDIHRLSFSRLKCVSVFSISLPLHRIDGCVQQLDYCFITVIELR